MRLRFCFCLCRHHRVLHSFPTRRSSDLRPEIRRLAPTVKSTSPGSGARLRASMARYSARVPSRSEEHTSELQSHSDLVCRLLLEKTKLEVTKITNAACASGDSNGTMGRT